jgi:hypothetical protein
MNRVAAAKYAAAANEQEWRFREAESKGTAEAYEEFLEVDTLGGPLEKRRILILRRSSPRDLPSDSTIREQQYTTKEVEIAYQERLFRKAEAKGTIEAYERFLELDKWGGLLEVEAERRIDKLRGTSARRQ